MIRDMLSGRQGRLTRRIAAVLCMTLVFLQSGPVEVEASAASIGTPAYAFDITGDGTLKPHEYSVFDEKETQNTAVISSSMNTTVSEDGGNIGRCVVKEKVHLDPYFRQYHPTVVKYRLDPKFNSKASINKRGFFIGKQACEDIVIYGLDSAGQEVTSRKITVDKPSLKFGTVTDLSASINAANYISGTTVSVDSWKSSNENVAIVNKDTGAITVLKKGSTTITAFFGENKNAAKVKAKLKVDVPTLSKKAVSLKVSDSVRLKIKGVKKPDVNWAIDHNELVSYKNGFIEWVPVSDNRVVASVDHQGWVTGEDTGRCVLTASFKDKYGNNTKLKCRVYVGLGEEQSYTVSLNSGTTTVKGHFDFAMSDEIFDLVNQYRQSEGLGDLKTYTDLDETAMTRAVELSYQTSHERPNEDEWSTALPDKYFMYAGENLAAGYKSASAFFKAWKKSSGHNANMLNEHFTRGSMAVFISDSSNTGGISYKYYAIQCFTSEPLNAKPGTDEH
ncbi:Uncharacterized conserved protein YkwD, contains CAP (CSP/antigen 5/PR1) domain [Lachnospiraceae bacterium]|nr:Uncharacterized conserved protein YkwD, contains CAP (CSP/antigen 5/PR1) domain [Lachnospiraceae bacterium]